MHRSITSALLLSAFAASPSSFAQGERNSLIGVITEAPGTPNRMGAQLTFTGLSGGHPVMVWFDGYDSKLSKIFEDSSLLVLQSVASVGSTETVYIERKNRRFLVISVGAMGVPAGQTATVYQYRGSIR